MSNFLDMKVAAEKAGDSKLVEQYGKAVVRGLFKSFKKMRLVPSRRVFFVHQGELYLSIKDSFICRSGMVQTFPICLNPFK